MPKATVCKVYVCKDEKTGHIVMRPDGCKKGEFLQMVKQIREQKGFDLHPDDVLAEE